MTEGEARVYAILLSQAQDTLRFDEEHRGLLPSQAPQQARQVIRTVWAHMRARLESAQDTAGGTDGRQATHEG